MGAPSAPAKISASVDFAVVSPAAPAPSCSSAISRVLWVFEWG